METNKIYCIDAIEFLKKIEDNSINLIVIDPPYNIGKDTWDKIENYTEWLGNIFKESQRILKDNGSFYFFHNDFLKIVELQNYINQNTDFIFKQFIVWNKKFKGTKTEGFLQGFNEPEMLRNYQKMAEYILYYTFQDDSKGHSGIYDEMRKKLNKERLKAGFKTLRAVNQYLGVADNGGGMASHYFSEGNQIWGLPTKDMYAKLQKSGYFKKPYEDLRKEYEDLRYTFNNQKTHHSVWNYEIEKKQGHLTPKPLNLIKNIILHSSNKGDTVLDCFMGSGTTAIASIQTQRNFIGCDNCQKYIDIANKRIKPYLEQKSLF